MKNTPLKYRLNVIGGGLIIFIVIRTYLPMAAASVGLRDNFNIWLLVYMATLALACLLPVAFIENMCDFHPVLLKKPQLTATDGLLVMSSMFLFILLAIVNSGVLAIAGKVGIVFPAQALEPVDSGLTLLMYFVFSTVVPAVFEELFIRGIVLNLLLPNGKRFAILASAFLFMMMHTQVQSFIPVFGAGVVLACVYLYTGSIYSSMALHFVNNTYSFMMLYMQQRVNGISAMGFASFVISFILVCGVSSLTVMKKKDIDIFKNLKKTGKERSMGRMFTCPVLVLGLGCCALAIFSQLYADLVM